MQGPARMLIEPCADLGMLLGCVVIDHRLNRLSGRNDALDGLEKAYEPLVPLPLHVATQHRRRAAAAWPGCPAGEAQRLRSCVQPMDLCSRGPGLDTQHHAAEGRSACVKSSTLNNSGRARDRARAQAAQSSRLSAAGWRPLPKTRNALRANPACFRSYATTSQPARAIGKSGSGWRPQHGHGQRRLQHRGGRGCGAALAAAPGRVDLRPWARAVSTVACVAAVSAVGAEGIRARGQGGVHCVRLESHTSRWGCHVGCPSAAAFRSKPI